MTIKKWICSAGVIVWGIAACSHNETPELQEQVKGLKNVTTYSADTEPAFSIEFREEQSFGDTDSVVVGEYTDVEAGPSGQVFIADGQQSDIKVYSPDGRFLTSLGREGSGPAEFRNVQDLQTSGHYLFAHDMNQNKSVLFSLDSLTHSQSLILADNKNEFDELEGTFQSNYRVRSDHTMIMSFVSTMLGEDSEDWSPVNRVSRYYSLDKNGKIASAEIHRDTSASQMLIPFGPRRTSMRIDFLPEPLVTVDGEEIVTARSNEFLIKYHNSEGQYQRAVYYPYQPAELTEQSLQQAEVGEYIIENADQMELPEHWPVIAHLIPDIQNRLWVATITDDMSVYSWKVLNEKGELLAAFTWPRSRQLKAVQGDKVYALIENKETGIHSVIRFSFELE